MLRSSDSQRGVVWAVWCMVMYGCITIQRCMELYGCMAPGGRRDDACKMYRAKYSETQRNTAEIHTARHTAKLRIQPPVGLMSQAIPLAELERRLQIRLTSPIPGWAMQCNYKPNLVRGHEAAIRLIDADNFVCRCCPAPLHNNGMFKTGLTFDNVQCHVGTRKHSASSINPKNEDSILVF